MGFNLLKFDSCEALNIAIATTVSQQLSSAMQSQQQVTLAVSGGSTPAQFFQQISHKKIDWRRVLITLVDERCVKLSSTDSNAKLVKDQLLINNASEASFFPLVTDDHLPPDIKKLESDYRASASLPLNVTILGMGNDGHTASLFPCSPTIKTLIEDKTGQLFHLVKPNTAPYTRATFSLPTLLQSQKIILHIVGSQKRQVLEQAIAGTDPLTMPIRAFLHHPKVLIDIYWAPKQGELK